MKALILNGPGDVRLEDAPRPELTGTGDALVRVTHSSICGSDLGPYASGPHHGRYAMGHEAIGVIEETGTDVRTLSRGDRVVIAGTAGCGHCAPCRRSEAMLCDSVPYPPVFGHGFPGLGGCQAEALAVPAADFNLIKLPPSIPDEVGVLLSDTLATASAALERALPVHGGGTVAVIGLGAVGLQAVLVAKARGAEHVVAFDPLPDRRARAVELGADAHDPLGFPADRFAVDAVVDAYGSPETLGLALGLLRKGGAVSVVGLPKEETAPLPVHVAMGKSASLHYVACSIQAQIPTLLDELRAGALPVQPLVELFTHRFPLTEGARAYELFAGRAGGALKVLLGDQAGSAAPEGR